MCGKQSRKLGSCRIRAIDNEGHEEEGKGQIFRIKVDDEEADLTRWAVLCECVCVRERECGKEGIAIQETACECLLLS
jgi:hypothetical protein